VKTAVSAPAGRDGAAPDPARARPIAAKQARRAEDARLLRAALETGDFAAVAQIAHRLKGLGSTYGHDAISATGRALEAAAAQRDSAQIQVQIECYRQILADLH